MITQHCLDTGTARPGSPLLVLPHGRGADEQDLLRLGGLLRSDAVVVCPRAPFPAAPWGYGPGWAWYRFLERDRPEPETFRAGQEALGRWLDALPAQLPFPTGPLVLGGFSQGGTMSLAFALREPGRVSAVLNLSGFLADHPDVQVSPETVAGTRIFWGHGRHDTAIPFALAQEGRDRLRAAGADLTERDYETGHWIDEREVRDVREWMGEGRG